MPVHDRRDWLHRCPWIPTSRAIMGLPSTILHIVLPIVYRSRLLRYLGLLMPVVALLPVRVIGTAAVLISVWTHCHSTLWPIHQLLRLRCIFGQVEAYGHDACEDEDRAEVVEEHLSESAGRRLVPVEVKDVGCDEADFYYRAEEERKGDQCDQEYCHLKMPSAEVSEMVGGELPYQLLLISFLFQ